VTGSTRRQFLAIALGAAGWRVARAGRLPGSKMLTRKIPRTGEELPVVGMGTYETFDVGPEPAARAPLIDVARAFFAAGARVIDSSPMYGRSEGVIGDVLGALQRPQAFLATKVWTRGKREGIEQMTRSEKLLGARVDLMQIHNLVDWQTHLATLREWKAAGRIRYIGVTHYALSAFEELERIVTKEKIDFVQIPYSLEMREAEKRLLPAAADNQTAVLVMRPFERGGLISRFKGQPLPPFAAEIDCTTWAQLLLKFVIAHPAVTAPIPATSKLEHMQDDLRAGFGRMPGDDLRKRIAALV
jgi:diketogulonate reductase-like aldo/keto reductase